MINFEPLDYTTFTLSEHFDTDKLKKALAKQLENGGLSGYFGISRAESDYEITDNLSGVIGFVDPASKHDFPGAPLRNVLSYLSQSRSETVKVLALKDLISTNPNNFSLSNSQLYEIELPQISEIKFLGWEPNVKGKSGPRVVDLRPQLDPLVLAQNAVDLNLKLMR